MRGGSGDQSQHHYNSQKQLVSTGMTGAQGLNSLPHVLVPSFVLIVTWRGDGRSQSTDLSIISTARTQLTKH